MRIFLSRLCHSEFNIFCICRLSVHNNSSLICPRRHDFSRQRLTDEMVGLMHAEFKIPLFTKSYRVHAQDVESIRELAGLYIHVERVIGIVCAKLATQF